MTDLQRFGGYAALGCAATYLFGIALMVAVFEPAGFSTLGTDPAQTIAFLTSQRGLLSAWYLVIYVANAIALTILVVALYDRMSGSAPVAGKLSGAFGLIWATLVLGAGMVANVGLAAAVKLGATDPEGAAALWRMAELVENGLGGGNEIAGGVWVITVGLAGLAGGLPRMLNWFGIVIGLCGLATILPPLEAAGMVFGLGFIAWFAWAGIALLRG